MFVFFNILNCRTGPVNHTKGFVRQRGRSPEKEVYFRSWDFANSQMCEVRVATSNICGCNPPNRCGKRSGADFATSPKYTKVLRKCKFFDKFCLHAIYSVFFVYISFCISYRDLENLLHSIF